VDDFEASLPSEHFAPEPPKADSELLNRIYVEIRKMEPIDRSLILLSLDGMSYREMAEIHGLSESNIGVRITRARQKLSAKLKEVAHELR
jgi:RNA polymerase sigma-70 factor (ECF subfamily)